MIGTVPGTVGTRNIAGTMRRVAMTADGAAAACATMARAGMSRGVRAGEGGWSDRDAPKTSAAGDRAVADGSMSLGAIGTSMAARCLATIRMGTFIRKRAGCRADRTSSAVMGSTISPVAGSTIHVVRRNTINVVMESTLRVELRRMISVVTGSMIRVNVAMYNTINSGTGSTIHAGTGSMIRAVTRATTRGGPARKSRAARTVPPGVTSTVGATIASRMPAIRGSAIRAATIITTDSGRRGIATVITGRELASMRPGARSHGEHGDG